MLTRWRSLAKQQRAASHQKNSDTGMLDASGCRRIIPRGSGYSSEVHTAILGRRFRFDLGHEASLRGAREYQKNDVPRCPEQQKLSSQFSSKAI